MPLLSQEQKEELDRIAKFGFSFVEMLNAIPQEIKDMYDPYFKKRGRVWYARKLALEFSSVTLAITKGFSPEERTRHLAEKKKAREAAR